MAQKIVHVEGVGTVIVSRRRGARNIRLSVTPKGQVRVSLPYWLPYQSGVSFAAARKEWIASHMPTVKTEFNDSDRIGKSYRLKIKQDAKVVKLSARISGSEIVVSVPAGASHVTIQQKVREASEKAMKKEAQKLLAVRLSRLAKTHGYCYESFKVRKLTSRWGSCSSRGEITLSLFLMQLPWQLIDYVILHELVHTRHPDHSQDFWATLTKTLPNARKLQKELKSHRPILQKSNIA